MTSIAAKQEQEAVNSARVLWRSVIIFVTVAFALAWLAALPLWLDRGLKNPIALLLLVVMMFTPAIAALLVIFVVQKPRPRSVSAYLGLWPIRPVKRTVWMIVFAISGCIAIVVVGIALAAALGLVRLDLTNFSGYAAQLAALSPQPIPVPIPALVALQFLLIPAAALFNGFVTIGEELGWRGWLLPSLRPLGTWPALLITGAVWGLWHSPIILLGYNFNQPNLFGVALMVVGCVLLGVIIGWLRLRTASIWPSVFAHGAFNAASSALLLVSIPGTAINSPALNPLGWVTWIVMALVIVILVATGQFTRQPTPTLVAAMPPKRQHEPTGQPHQR